MRFKTWKTQYGSVSDLFWPLGIQPGDAFFARDRCLFLRCLGRDPKNVRPPGPSENAINYITSKCCMQSPLKSLHLKQLLTSNNIFKSSNEKIQIAEQYKKESPKMLIVDGWNGGT